MQLFIFDDDWFNRFIANISCEIFLWAMTTGNFLYCSSNQYQSSVINETFRQLIKPLFLSHLTNAEKKKFLYVTCITWSIYSMVIICTVYMYSFAIVTDWFDYREATCVHARVHICITALELLAFSRLPLNFIYKMESNQWKVICTCSSHFSSERKRLNINVNRHLPYVWTHQLASSLNVTETK
jgi:hypothetical protein